MLKDEDYQLFVNLLKDSENESFDSLTELAINVLQVPVSLVSIIDYDNERQVFKSQVGLNEPWATQKETPLTHSFCQHVANQDIMFCVEDATKHDLVKDNLAIPELGVIAYLGTPIRNETGKAIGAFCVISGVPRSWNNRDKEIVSRLARCVNDVIKLKAALVREGHLKHKQEELTSLLSQNLQLR